MIERRRSQRVPPPLSLYGSVRATEKARIVDISPHGIQVAVASPLIPADKCHISLPVEDGVLKVRALVHRCRCTGGELPYRAGLEFLKLTRREVEMIEDKIVDICLTELP
jgi:hypothetical protein